MPAFSISSSSTIGALPITTASATSSARVWPPESSVIAASRMIGSPVSWFANSIVSATTSAGRAAPRTRACVVRNRCTGRSERNVVCWVMSAIGFDAGSSTNDSGGTASFTRTRRPDGVFRFASSAMSLMSAVLPEPVGPTIERTWPISRSSRGSGSGRPSRPWPPITVTRWISTMLLAPPRCRLARFRQAR
jgi:hypothetical protein